MSSWTNAKIRAEHLYGRAVVCLRQPSMKRAVENLQSHSEGQGQDVRDGPVGSMVGQQVADRSSWYPSSWRILVAAPQPVLEGLVTFGPARIGQAQSAGSPGPPGDAVSASSENPGEPCRSLAPVLSPEHDCEQPEVGRLRSGAALRRPRRADAGLDTHHFHRLPCIGPRLSTGPTLRADPELQWRSVQRPVSLAAPPGRPARSSRQPAHLIVLRRRELGQVTAQRPGTARSGDRQGLAPGDQLEDLLEVRHIGELSVTAQLMSGGAGHQAGLHQVEVDARDQLHHVHLRQAWPCSGSARSTPTRARRRPAPTRVPTCAARPCGGSASSPRQYVPVTDSGGYIRAHTSFRAHSGHERLVVQAWRAPRGAILAIARSGSQLTVLARMVAPGAAAFLVTDEAAVSAEALVSVLRLVEATLSLEPQSSAGHGPTLPADQTRPRKEEADEPARTSRPRGPEDGSGQAGGWSPGGSAGSHGRGHRAGREGGRR